MSLATTETTRITNIAAYKFVNLDRLSWRRKQLYALCKQGHLRGTILLSTEGINLFVAGSADSVEQLLAHLRRDARFADLEAKYSYSDRVPFRRLLVKVKKEIIAFDVPGIQPERMTSPKLSPQQLKQWLDAGRPVRLLDVRNDYEVKLGSFKHAESLGIDRFREFPDKVNHLPDDWKGTPIVMYCTGGIRCEKAGPMMQQAGFKNVYQLDGGILNYFEQCGGIHYQGECFVFDQRVALDAQLTETSTTICYCCQATLTQEDQRSFKYALGESCPYCFQTPRETMRQVIARRQSALQKLTTPLPGSVPYENRRPIHVPHRCDGQTLWQVITHVHPYVAVETWQAAVEQGRLQSDGRVMTGDEVVRAGQRIENVIPQTVEPDVSATIEILYEDAMIVVLNKPAPLPMHPCGRFNRNTLISIVNQLYRPQVLRVAHRLDANTTGLVVLSRTRPIARQLQPQFERGEVLKTYLARVNGHPAVDSFRCDAAINEAALRAGRREVGADGLPSCTEFEVLQRDDDGTALLLARPITGRTNQIRLHLAHLGWPVCGDPMYGADPSSEPIQTLSPSDPPLCLHAWKISFYHPADRKRVAFQASAPGWAAFK